MTTTLTSNQQSIITISAFGANGDLDALENALHTALDAGLTLSVSKEILTQLYAYAGFPRSLNALGQLMKVVNERKARGIKDAEGSAPHSPIPVGVKLLEAGTANQTKLVGEPVRGALFDFAPAIDQFLKTHLFGDIFERDNLDWHSRELATLGMLSALKGAESQLQSHLGFSLNVGVNVTQLNELISVLLNFVSEEASVRAKFALDRCLSDRRK